MFSHISVHLQNAKYLLDKGQTEGQHSTDKVTAQIIKWDKTQVKILEQAGLSRATLEISSECSSYFPLKALKSHILLFWLDLIFPRFYQQLLSYSTFQF